MSRRLAVFCLFVLIAPMPSAELHALPAPLCGFECNVMGLDICVYTGVDIYRCFQIRGGCISGPSAVCIDQPAF